MSLASMHASRHARMLGRVTSSAALKPASSPNDSSGDCSARARRRVASTMPHGRGRPANTSKSASWCGWLLPSRMRECDSSSHATAQRPHLSWGSVHNYGGALRSDLVVPYVQFCHRAADITGSKVPGDKNGPFCTQLLAAQVRFGLALLEHVTAERAHLVWSGVHDGSGTLHADLVAPDVQFCHEAADTERIGEDLRAFRSEAIVRNTKYKSQM